MDQPMNMRESAIAVNEYFNSLLDSGFSRTEALYLVAAMISPGGVHPPKDGEDK